MLSPLHEVLVELIRSSPGLLSAYLGDRIPALARKGLRFDTDHTRASRIVEVGNELLFKVYGRQGKLLCALVIEVQLSRKRAKARTWALYAAWAHYRPRCPVHVVVIAVDEKVAKWAAGPFCIGDMTLRPWVIGPQDMKPITSMTDARRSVEMTFLSGMAHRDSAVAKDVGRALRRALDVTEHEHASAIWNIHVTFVGSPVRRVLAMELGSWVPQSTWARRSLRRARPRGEARGRRKAAASPACWCAHPKTTSCSAQW